MANNYKNTSLFDELCGSHTAAEEPKLSDKPGATPELTASPSDAIIPQQIGPLNPLYDGRTVRPAGHMVVGARAPVPRPNDEMRLKGFETAQLFSSKDTERKRIHGSGAAIALACAVTVGSTAVFTSAVGNFSERRTQAEDSQQAGLASEYGDEIVASTGSTNQEVVNAILAEELGVEPPQQSITGELKVAAIGPIALPRSTDSTNSDFIRIAQHDAEDLKVSDVTGVPGADLPINISLEEASSEAYSFIMIRGLPAEITLSAGFRLKESWAVSLRDINALSLKSPRDYEGDFNLEILLIKGRNTPAVSQVMNVRIHPQQQPSAQAVARVEPQIEKPVIPVRAEPQPERIEPKEAPKLLTAAPAAVDPVEELEKVAKPAPQVESRPALQPQLPPLQMSLEEEKGMLAKAQGILDNGDIASARLIYEHLARKGSIKATFALAQTYDPEFFSQLNVIGLRPDPETAKKWYAKAASMGNAEANARLSALGN